MAICLEYQSVYSNRRESSVSLKYHLVAAVLLLGALVTRVTLKIHSTSVGYELAKERTINVELDMQRRELELERSLLLRPDNLTKAAYGLGLRPLDMAQAKKVRY